LRARLVIGSLLALSLVSGPHGIAQESEKPPTPRPSPDALRVPTDAEDAALFHTVLGVLTHDLELPVEEVTLETLDASTFDQVLANARVRQDASDLRAPPVSRWKPHPRAIGCARPHDDRPADPSVHARAGHAAQFGSPVAGRA
jgi:hypothetical protein